MDYISLSSKTIRGVIGIHIYRNSFNKKDECLEYDILLLN